MPSLLITVLIGAQIATLPEIILETWTETFKKYPYLIQATANEAESFFDYITDEHSMLLIAKVDNEFAGFLITAPLQATEKSFNGTIEAFENAGLDPSDYYYVSDVIVLPKFRGKGIASQLLNSAKQQAQEWGYGNLCLVTIKQEQNHPLKPDEYVNPDTVWKKQGFAKTKMEIITMWQTIVDDQGNSQERENIFVFWTKEIK